MLELVIGNYNYSSWSLRAWLHLRLSEIPFRTTRVALFSGNWQRDVGRYSPAGRVPVLLDGDLAIWDSMAIMEYVIEREPRAVAWPVTRQARARARSICAEMHSGFIAIRNELPQNLRARTTLDPESLSDACRAQLQRVDEIWTECRTGYGGAGPWLFGGLTVADIVYAPVALRLVTYGIATSAAAGEFVSAVRGLAPLDEWMAAATAEEERLEFVDDLRPIAATPLTPG